MIPSSVYLAGPMTGIPEFNLSAFDIAVYALIPYVLYDEAAEA